MALSVAQLLTPMSRQEALDALLEQLDALGFSASSWQSGSKRRAIVEIGAIVWADMSLTVRTLTQAVFLQLASGVLLREFVRSHYDLTPNPALATQGTAILTAAATSGPHNISIGQLVAANAQGRTFRNITAGVLPLGGTLSLSWEAEVAGEDGNIPINTLTVLQTPIAGVTINNPGSGVPAQWITRTGQEAESEASLKARAQSRWAQLSIERPEDAYVGLALDVAGVTRVEIDPHNPGGAGTVDVWAAGPTSTVSSGPGSVLEALQDALDAKRAVSAIVTARAALEQSVDVTTTIFVEAGKYDGPGGSFEGAIEEAIADFINAQPISGQVLPPSSSGHLDRESLIAAIKAVDGVVAISIAAPAADVAIAAHTIAVVGTLLINYQEV